MVWLTMTPASSIKGKRADLIFGVSMHAHTTNRPKTPMESARSVSSATGTSEFRRHDWGSAGKPRAFGYPTRPDRVKSDEYRHGLPAASESPAHELQINLVTSTARRDRCGRQVR